MNKIKTFLPHLSSGLFVLMIAGCLFSRALLSITTGLWVIVIIFSLDKRTIKLYKPLLVWSVVPLIIFLLGVYQQLSAKGNYDYLLTLLTYPVAAFAALVLKPGQQKHIAVWILFAIASLVYPLAMYISRFDEMNVLYGHGQSLPTLMDGDHVRYGIFLNAALLFAIFVPGINFKIRMLLASVLIVAIVAMAVRTAWIGLIISLVSVIFFSKNIKFKRWLLLLVVPLFALAYFLFPSVSQKIKYTIYDWQMYSPTSYDPDYSDGARRTINYVALKAIETNPAVGWAAVPSTLNKTFKQIFPAQQLNYGWPFNQWLYWCMASGWVGMLLFTGWLLYPAYYGLRNKNYFLFAWTFIISASCLVESTLNFQYGVFLHAWPIALLWIGVSKNGAIIEENTAIKNGVYLKPAI